ncbi:hypothetical protein [Angelakisella massiliensis]|uniref:hypothetical protein n=1 Tax=Angelakisella massiliensis TaxID=1871018 RepID=UPI0008F89FE2|nr:hypothetical protein [Angelakisella massiliensis]
MEKQELYTQLDRLGFHTQEALNRFMGNEALFLSFVRQLPQKLNLASIRQELEAEDEETFYIGVHNLKGLAGNLSMVHIQECAQAILVEFRTSKFKNKKKLSSLIQEAETESEAIVKTIEQYLKEEQA